jgi:hypothetical protein
MLYEYRKGKSVAQATRDIRSTYGDEALVERTCQKWFAKFRTGNFGLDDEPEKEDRKRWMMPIWKRYLKKTRDKLCENLRNSSDWALRLWIDICTNLEK